MEGTMRISRTIGCLAVATVLTAGNLADAQAPRIDSLPMPANAAQLDDFLARAKITDINNALTQVTQPNDIQLDANWERKKALSGSSYFISMMYSYDLLRLVALKALPAQDLEGSAIFLLYAYAQTVLDGTKCEDQTAPPERTRFVVSSQPQVWKAMADMTPERRGQLIKAMMMLENVIAPYRPNDEILCRGGLTETIQALKENGDRAVETPPQPGQIGKTITIPPPENYKPRFLAEEVWRPKQDDLRAKLPDLLDKIIIAHK
jgi:hypothetical protein